MAEKLTVGDSRGDTMPNENEETIPQGAGKSEVLTAESPAVVEENGAPAEGVSAEETQGEGDAAAEGEGSGSAAEGRRPAAKQDNESFKNKRLVEKLSKEVDGLRTELRSNKEGQVQRLTPEQIEKIEQHYGKSWEDIQKDISLIETAVKPIIGKYSSETMALKRQLNEEKFAKEHPDYKEFSEEIHEELDAFPADLQADPKTLQSLYYQARGRNLEVILSRERQRGMKEGIQEKTVVSGQLLEKPNKTSEKAGTKQVLSEKESNFARKLGISSEAYAKRKQELAERRG